LLASVSLVLLVSLFAITFMMTIGLFRVCVARRRTRRHDHHGNA